MTRLLAWALASLIGFTGPITAEPFIVVQSTTSTENSGFFDAILPKFEATSGIDVRVVAVGTGQAIKNAMRGDGDVLFVHARADEDAFVAAGFAGARLDVMYNDFLIVGPVSDPARVASATSAQDAFARLTKKQSLFLSRGDQSGTHKKELTLWETVPDPKISAWYRETGAGMGATLNMGVALSAYTLTDRATWAAFANMGQHRVLFEGDAAFHNPYGIMVVTQSEKRAEASAFADWITGPAGQQAISEFRIAGRQVFFPNAQQ